MNWIRENWFFIMFFALCIAMHIFGHKRHGGHGGHGEGDGEHSGHLGYEKTERKYHYI